jgi:hypothetical protein
MEWLKAFSTDYANGVTNTNNRTTGDRPRFIGICYQKTVVCPLLFDKSLTDFFPSVEIIRRQYRDAGQHQVTLWAGDEQSFATILGHKAVQQAGASLALRVMRKRATIYSKFHCKHVASNAIGTNG